MSALAPIASFATAYRQLRPSEKVYVDGYVADVEREASRRGERISNALAAPITADVVAASRGMLDRPLVRAAITERINDIAAAAELTVPRVVKELMAVSFSNLGHYMEVREDGQPYFDLASATPEQLSAIKSIEIEESGSPMERGGLKRKFKFTLHDKLGGLAMLTKFMGMMEQDNPHWRADQPRTATPVLAAGVSDTGAADAYAQFING